ncbi:MAG TPA: ABC transporter permease [Trebonia sp.]|nr:ABC transporter permease [Trebonia sp.]
MFFTYISRELRRRMRQAIFIAIGLGLGIGLVITVTAASAGVKNAQASVLHSLYGVGTDITVTKTAAAGSTGNGFGFGFRQSIGSTSRPKAGSKIDNNTLSSGGTLASISSSNVTSIAKMDNVAAAAGGLTLSDRTISGTVPALNFNNGGGGGGGFQGGGGGGSNSGSGNPSSFGANFNINSFTVNGVDIANGELGPLSTGKVSSGRTFTTADNASDVALVDASYATQNKLKVGSTIAVGNSKNTATNFKVVGIVSEPAGDNPADVYIPLGVAQTLANMKNDVNTIYVTASNSGDISSVASSISKAVPGSTVTDQNTLASEVTGSISSAASLANNLGKWLAIAVLIASFLLASLLTMAAVTRRVREFGTLKALGWKSRRIVFQVMGEAVAIGIAGGVIGVGLGFAGAALVNKFSSPLTASLASNTTGSATPGGARNFGGGGFPGGGAAPTGGAGGGNNPFRGAFSNAARTAGSVTEHLHAPVTIAIIIVAVGLAILGGLIAGAFGGWRAARLRPADALSKVA